MKISKQFKQVSVFHSTAKIFLFVVLFITLSCTAVFAEDDGLSFSADTLYKTAEPLSALPMTYEATVMLPTDISPTNDRWGAILSNYQDGTTKCISIEIYNDRKPRIYWIGDNGAVSLVFGYDAATVPKGEWVHIAITFDPDKKEAKCYINGKLIQTGSNVSYPKSIDIKNGVCLGGDLRTGNAQNFKGRIKNVAVYNDVRTAAEIAADYTAESPATDGLIAAYKPSADDQIYVKDISGNGYDAVEKSWVIEEKPLDDYAYSFAVVGDTQTITEGHPEYLGGIYDWIIDNAEKYNTKFVFGLGDITNSSTNFEWALAKLTIHNLDGILPYSIVRGNHDTVEQFNKFFPYSECKEQVSGTMDGTMLNTYKKFSVGNIKYLVLNLDFGAPDNVLEWADEIISANKDRNIIITTHAYLNSDGTTLDANETSSPTKYDATYNNGDEMWDTLIKKHKNIVLVLSGHIIYDKVIMTQTTGDNGNTVTQMLINPQGADNERGGLGLVAMLHFSEDGKNVQLRYYSTVKKAYFMSDNQYSFTIDTTASDTVEEDDEIKVNNFSFNAALNEGISGKVIAALYNNNRLISSKVYDAGENVPVSFENVPSGSRLKLLWWDGSDTIIPISSH